MSTLVEPANWRTGFSHPWRIGCGGTEVPFIRNGNLYLYVWNSAENKHYYYSFAEDLFILDMQFPEHCPVRF